MMCGCVAVEGSGAPWGVRHDPSLGHSRISSSPWSWSLPLSSIFVDLVQTMFPAAHRFRSRRLHTRRPEYHRSRLTILIDFCRKSDLSVLFQLTRCLDGGGCPLGRLSMAGLSSRRGLAVAEKKFVRKGLQFGTSGRVSV